MVTEVFPNLHMFKVPLPGKWLPYVLVYCFKGDDGYTLVDCGWNTDEAWDALTGQMTEIGADIKDVSHLIVTHIHPDHYGLAGRLRDTTGCEVMLHEREQVMVADRYTHPEKLLDSMKKFLLRQGIPNTMVEELHKASMPVRDYVMETEPDRRLKGGERIRIGNYTLETLWTPGHSRGHICLVERDVPFIMTGDHVLPTISPNVSLHAQSDENPLQDYVESLEKLKPFGIMKGLAAHEYIIEDLPARIDELEQHHKDRLGEMMTAIANGADTCYEVAGAVKWATGSFDDFAPMTKRAAVTETLAHLQYARSRGMLNMEEREGIVRLSLAEGAVI